jgi:hypothetical protein
LLVVGLVLVERALKEVAGMKEGMEEQEEELGNECDDWDHRKRTVRGNEVGRNRRGHERMKGVEESKNHDCEGVEAKWLQKRRRFKTC